MNTVAILPDNHSIVDPETMKDILLKYETSLPKKGDVLTGEIISNDEGSLTLKLGDGGSKTVFLPESTKITKSVEGGIVDLTEGINVVVSGKEDASGNYSASSVQVIEGGLRTDLSDE